MRDRQQERPIEAMALWTEKLLRKHGDDPLKPKVLLLAFTGKAASLIGNLFKSLKEGL